MSVGFDVSELPDRIAESLREYNLASDRILCEIERSLRALRSREVDPSGWTIGPQESAANDEQLIAIAGKPDQRLVVHGVQALIRAAAVTGDVRVRLQEQDQTPANQTDASVGLATEGMRVRWEGWIGDGVQRGGGTGIVNDKGFIFPEARSAVCHVQAAGAAAISVVMLWGWYERHR